MSGNKILDDWEFVHPTPESPQSPLAHSTHGKYSERWCYFNYDGDLIGWVCRFDTDNGKQILPLTLWKNKSGEWKWKWKAFPKPRPLYGLWLLKEYPENNVLIVGDEKCAFNSQQILPTINVLSWVGGISSIKYVDWTPLKDRKVVLWADNDIPEKVAIWEVYNQISEISEGVRFVNVSDDKPKKWNIADAIDEGWDEKKILKFIKSSIINPEEGEVLEQGKTIKTKETKSDQRTYSTDILEDAPFRCLGYNRGYYYYLPQGSYQIVALTLEKHSPKNLIGLAPLQWWERSFPGRKGADWMGIVNTLHAASIQAGVYYEDKVRGSGAWFDDKRIVLHLGDRLIVDGKITSILDLKTVYIYQASKPIEYQNTAPLKKSEANKFSRLVDMLAWVKPISSRLLSGWCVLSMISGALYWRPHIWITGKSGTGKSWISKKIIKPVVGPGALIVEAGTTNPGIRQFLQHNAVPVLFDEADAENKFARERILNILEIIRLSSSEDCGRILKGTVSGRGMSFRIRSCFCLSSVNVSMNQKADISRITVLDITEHYKKKVEMFEIIRKTTDELLTKEWCSGFRSRAISMIPVIRKNAEVFSRAAAIIFNEQRLGDQMGALLSGAYSLFNDSEISFEDAKTWIEKHEWKDKQAEEDADEQRCLYHILQHIIIVNDSGKRLERSIMRLITYVSEIRIGQSEEFDSVTQTLAKDTLAMHGLKINTDKTILYISNSHRGIANILKDTVWSVGWYRILARIKGAVEKTSCRFEYAMRTRAVGIPLNIIFDKEE